MGIKFVKRKDKSGDISNRQEIKPISILLESIRWGLVSSLIGVLSGTASAFVLFSLEWATQTRESHFKIITLLPFAGFFVGALYYRFGREIEGGSNLVLEKIHNEIDQIEIKIKKPIPFKMAPFVWLGTVVTHLFGGSAGREGTAVQMGAVLSDQLSVYMNPRHRPILLMAGMSAGFSSIFGTPFAGALFSLEVLGRGQICYRSILPCLIAAWIGDRIASAWGAVHTHYSMGSLPPFSVSSLTYLLLAGVCFGLMARIFSKVSHVTAAQFKLHIGYPPVRALVGGAIVALIVFLSGSTQLIGLGIPTIIASFSENLPPWTSIAKVALTAITLGAGFKGGEVTPLFFIGATLGNSLSIILPLPRGLLSATGFVGVFAGAANTPFASILMAVELFGMNAGVYAVIVCLTSFLVSGHPGIYYSKLSSKHYFRNYFKDYLK